MINPDIWIRQIKSYGRFKKSLPVIFSIVNILNKVKDISQAINNFMNMTQWDFYFYLSPIIKLFFVSDTQ
ncbi:hypothetical protein HNQ74_000486 [Bartonella doshiae]|uniref:Uncharacterized protein n=2 Tax=Bartonella doshiae TaxID=33044 RepID=A0A380ZBY3_BARDO|nr:hypothetical protein MCS_00503 [Bartonella doshiae NCTC 12862 = ATCC 700133]MBB6159073.1 hypothetical protein [Bartonella doshiae]SUV44497.1 Uncharacterised protein [Bartonella doshiae]